MPIIDESNPSPATPSSIITGGGSRITIPGDGIIKPPAQQQQQQEEMSAEQLNEQINDLFNKIEANFEHNCRAFRTRSAMVMQKVEEMERSLQDLLDSLQDGTDASMGANTGSLGSTKPGPEMVSLVMADDDLRTPSVRP